MTHSSSMIINNSNLSNFEDADEENENEEKKN